MELRAIEILLPVAVAACSGWFSARGWNEAAGMLLVAVAMWCLVGAFWVGIVPAAVLVACCLFLAYPCGRVFGRLRELR